MFTVVCRLQALIIISVLLVAPQPASAESVACEDFDAWAWAQTVYDSDPDAYAALDPEGNGIACEQLPVDGFAPVLWADSIPESAVPAKVTSITDGDTFKVIVDGESDTIRMYHMDAP